MALKAPEHDGQAVIANRDGAELRIKVIYKVHVNYRSLYWKLGEKSIRTNRTPGMPKKHGFICLVEQREKERKRADEGLDGPKRQEANDGTGNIRIWNPPSRTENFRQRTNNDRW
jgi:hypothetical protein